MTASESAAELIESVVRKKFTDASIDSVRVVERRDHEGDDIFDIHVVYKSGPPDARKMLQIMIEARRKLLAMNVETFPLFRFISKSDATRVKPPEAA